MFEQPPHDATGDHHRAWEAIPWLANGSVSTEQRRWLETHLAGCEDCSRELARQRELHAALATVQPRADEAVVEAGLQRLLQRIDSGDVAVAPARREGALARWLAAAVIVESLALTALGLRLGLRSEPGYVTLSESASPAVAATIRVVPEPNLRVAELQRLLLDLDLQIVAGPNRVGAYDLAPRGGPQPRERQLASLRAEAGLKLVEPLDAEPSAR